MLFHFKKVFHHHSNHIIVEKLTELSVVIYGSGYFYALKELYCVEVAINKLQTLTALNGLKTINKKINSNRSNKRFGENLLETEKDKSECSKGFILNYYCD